jgi:hypothetical protein
MIRRVTMLSLAAGLLAAAAGCRSSCGHGWFTSAHDPAPCELVGTSVMPAPTTLVPGSAVPLAPGGSELPYPQPNDLIPRPGVPVPPAIPVPAPGDTTGLLPAPKLGTPVKSVK